MPLERIGLFGGTFDPVHRGHLQVAMAAQRELKLDRVVFLPVRISPHKTLCPTAGPRHRVAMLRRALLKHTGLILSRYDLDRPGPAYTIDAIHHFKKRYCRASFFLIMGSDSLIQFPRWKRFREIVKTCRLAVVPRPGFPVKRLPSSLRGKVDWIGVSGPALSSTQLRQWMASKRNAKKFLIPSVAAYIQRQSLYGPAS